MSTSGTQTASWAEIARWTHEGIARVLARHGRSLDEFDDTFDVFAEEQPALGSCYGASLSDRQLLGASPGVQTRKLVHPVRELRSPDEALAEVGGVNVHVGSAIDGNDRQRLERVCRYMTRTPVCQERLELSSAGQVVVRLGAGLAALLVGGAGLHALSHRARF